MDKINFEVGQKVIFKKNHPCGSKEWIIERTGADFRVKCVKCGRSLMLTRRNFEKSFKDFA